MRMRTLGFSTVGLVALVACGGQVPPPNAPTSAAGEHASTKDSSASADPKKEEKSGGGSSSDSKEGIKVGDKAPTFSIASMNGQGKVAVTPGKVTIVDFWATWCEPCRKSFPKYQELYVKYKASGLEIAAVSVDDEKNEIPSFAKTHGAKFPVGWDEGKKIAEKWKPENMPSAYIVDKKGVVRHVHRGYHDGEEKEIEKEIKALF